MAIIPDTIAGWHALTTRERRVSMFASERGAPATRPMTPVLEPARPLAARIFPSVKAPSGEMPGIFATHLLNRTLAFERGGMLE